MRYTKVPVEVVVAVKIDGSSVPMSIRWADGREFPISRATPKKRMRCEKTYGDAFRFECIINGRRKLLYRDDDGHYFVEVETPSDPEERLELETRWVSGPRAKPI